MIRFVLSALSGWLALFLLCVVVSIPYFVKAVRGSASPLPRMAQHYTLGLAVPALAFAHGWIAMSVGLARTVSQAGVWLATLALLCMLIQVLWGASLRVTSGAARQRAKSMHFLLMTVVGALTIAHIVLD